MAKLKFDRGLKLTFSQNEKTTVPNDEVWRGTVTGKNGIILNSSSIGTGNNVGNGVITNVLLGGGSTVGAETKASSKDNPSQASFTGVAFKVVE